MQAIVLRVFQRDPCPLKCPDAYVVTQESALRTPQRSDRKICGRTVGPRKFICSFGALFMKSYDLSSINPPTPGAGAQQVPLLKAATSCHPLHFTSHLSLLPQSPPPCPPPWPTPPTPPPRLPPSSPAKSNQLGNSKGGTLHALLLPHFWWPPPLLVTSQIRRF